MQVFISNGYIILSNSLLVIFITFLTVPVLSQSLYKPTREEVLQSYKSAALLDSLAKNSVFKSRVKANWQSDGFWYKNNLADSSTEYWWVNLAAGTRQKAFDQAKLSASLGKLIDSPIVAEKLQLTNISFDKKLCSSDKCNI